MLDPALGLEQAGIYNGKDLCMFSDKEIKDFNIDRNPLKLIYIRKFKNVRQWYYLENLDEDDWLRLSTAVIAHYRQMYPSNSPITQSQAAQGPNFTMPMTPPAMPVSTPPVPLVINITQWSDPAAEFIKGVKCLLDDFPMLKEDGKWWEWKKSVNITAKAQLVSKVLDGTYVLDIADITLFRHKQTYMFAVFKKSC